MERILSDEGILLRINRSIQAEGSFGELKQDMQFRRYLSRGTSNVLAESILLAMAKNVNKLHNKIQKGKMGKTFISFEECINLENPKSFSNPVLDCIKVRLFYEKAIISIETEQLYRENQKKGSCRFTI